MPANAVGTVLITLRDSRIRMISQMPPGSWPFARRHRPVRNRRIGIGAVTHDQLSKRAIGWVC
ncbi:hypothetical protein NSERUTF1_5597 [Nocardia seriolae]|nr:hypothetical protein NSERUTF1_5597 [Nocardia seriolae]